MLLAGIDLAWRPDIHPSAIALGSVRDDALLIEAVAPAVQSLGHILARLDALDGLRGIAIDASLIIDNVHGQRACERELSRCYGARKIACHASNLTLYPDPASVSLSRCLHARGFRHLDRTAHRWQIECYPHSAIVELFGLQERLIYKKGNVETRRQGQCELAALLRELARTADWLGLGPGTSAFLSPEHINTLRGQALKTNEDALDSIVCLIVAGHYAFGWPARVFGTPSDGYIYVPQTIEASFS